MQLAILDRVTTKDKAFMARQLAIMLTSGLTLDKSLLVISAQMRNLLLKKTLETIYADIEAGMTFSEALKKHSKIFDRVFINIVVSGEAIGKLGEVLLQLANQLEAQDEFYSKIKSALYYPVFILVLMAIIVGVMMVKVIPPLKDVFSEFQSTLPWTTRSLIWMSDFIAHYWYILFILIIGFIALIVYFVRTKQGKLIIDQFIINFTFNLGKDVYMARFARTMSMLIQAGTPILEAIDITSEVVNNIIYRKILKRVSRQVEKGAPMSVQLEKSKDFPVLIPQMVAVGERTGQMETVLDNLAKYYESESDEKIKALTSLFEPIVVVAIGIGVAFVVFAIIMPIYQIAQL